jgi:hypothetical protein
MLLLLLRRRAGEGKALKRSKAGDLLNAIRQVGEAARGAWRSLQRSDGSATGFSQSLSEEEAQARFAPVDRCGYLPMGQTGAVATAACLSFSRPLDEPPAREVFASGRRSTWYPTTAA